MYKDMYRYRYVYICIHVYVHFSKDRQHDHTHFTASDDGFPKETIGFVHAGTMYTRYVHFFFILSSVLEQSPAAVAAVVVALGPLEQCALSPHLLCSLEELSSAKQQKRSCCSTCKTSIGVCTGTCSSTVTFQQRVRQSLSHSQCMCQTAEQERCRLLRCHQTEHRLPLTHPT